MSNPKVKGIEIQIRRSMREYLDYLEGIKSGLKPEDISSFKDICIEFTDKLSSIEKVLKLEDSLNNQLENLKQRSVFEIERGINIVFIIHNTRYCESLINDIDEYKSISNNNKYDKALKGVIAYYKLLKELEDVLRYGKGDLDTVALKVEKFEKTLKSRLSLK